MPTPPGGCGEGPPGGNGLLWRTVQGPFGGVGLIQPFDLLHSRCRRSRRRWRRLVACVFSPTVAREILERLRLPARRLPRAPARGPPQQECSRTARNRRLSSRPPLELVCCRRKVVRAHHFRPTSQRPQCPLEAGDQRLERLAEGEAEPRPSRERQHELEEQVREGPPCTVTPRSLQLVKSSAPSRPGGCSCSKNTSFSPPYSARHSRMRRCSVRSCPSSSFFPSGRSLLSRGCWRD